MIEIGKFSIKIVGFAVLLCMWGLFGYGCANIPDSSSYGERKALPGIRHESVPNQQTIFAACAQRSEMTFYMAQEKLYNSGNATKLLAYMREHMEPTLFQMTQRGFMEMGSWVDNHDYPTAKDYAANLMMECITNAFYDARIEPDDESNFYMQRYWELLDSVEEQLLPYELDEPTEGIET